MTTSPSPRDTPDAFGDDRPHRPAEDAETVYYKGSPMVRGELGKVLLWSILGLAFIAAPILYYVFQDVWWPWYVILGLVLVGLVLLIIPHLIVRQVRYCISNYRIDYERGLLGKRIDTMELWHVDDINFRQSFFDRVMGVGTIVVFSDDQSTPNLELRGLPNPRDIFEKLKQRVISVKRQRGVIKMDVGS